MESSEIVNNEAASRAKGQAAIGPRSLGRLLKLFEVLASSPTGKALAELSAALKSPKSSLLNLLRPLVVDGYLTYEEGRYGLGTSMFRLAANIMSVWNFSGSLRPFLAELAESSGESVYLAVLDPARKNTIYVDAIDSEQPVRFSVPVGSSAPLYCTAAGRVLLAFGSAEFQEEYLRATDLKPLTSKTMTSRLALRERLERIRAAHVAESVDESVPGATAIAAPVVGADGKVHAAIVLGGPTERLQRQLAVLRPVIKKIAERASGLNEKAMAPKVTPAGKTKPRAGNSGRVCQ